MTRAIFCYERDFAGRWQPVVYWLEPGEDLPKPRTERSSAKDVTNLTGVDMANREVNFHFLTISIEEPFDDHQS